MKSQEKLREEIFSLMEIDWVALHQIVGRFFNSHRREPTRSEFLKALNFINDLLNEYEIICREGPNMVEVKGNGKEITDWILKMYNEIGYQKINFRIWFDRKRD